MIVQGSKVRRFAREERTGKCLEDYEKEQMRRELEIIKECDRKEMRQVEELFRVNCPFEITEELELQIQKVYIGGTKSKYGMILYLNRLIRWPEWQQMAMRHFNIDI